MGRKAGKRVSGGIYVCVCDTCILNDKSWPPIRLPGDCDYCKLVTPHWVRKDWIIPYPPKELLKFLKIKKICHFCFTSFSNTLRVDLGMCWADSSQPVMELAFIKVLNSDLRSAANKDIWEKTTLTKAMKNNEDTSEWRWATPQKMNEAIARIGS